MSEREPSKPLSTNAESLVVYELFGRINPLTYEALLSIVAQRLPQVADAGINYANGLRDTPESTAADAYLLGLVQGAYAGTQPPITAGEIASLEEVWAGDTPEPRRASPN